MTALSYLPTVNAILNGITSSLLVLGYIAIRRGHTAGHRRLMLAAVGCTAVFLTSYVIYHYNVGVTTFIGPDWGRTLYFTILWTHTPLAVTVVPLVVITLRRAITGQHAAHKRVARWTFPIWLYVSTTGILVYMMLYHWFPSRP